MKENIFNGLEYPQNYVFESVENGLTDGQIVGYAEALVLQNYTIPPQTLVWEQGTVVGKKYVGSTKKSE